jgi:metallo-beta-lactamase family protein
LLEGADSVHLFGEEVAVKAHIHDLTGLSAHADQAQLMAWASHFTPPKLTILTHGEPNSARTLGSLLEEKLHFTVLIPKKGQTIELGAK